MQWWAAVSCILSIASLLPLVLWRRPWLHCYMLTMLLACFVMTPQWWQVPMAFFRGCFSLGQQCSVCLVFLLTLSLLLPFSSNTTVSAQRTTLSWFSLWHTAGLSMGPWFFGCHYPQCHYLHMDIAFWLWNLVICEASPLQWQIANCTLQGVDSLVLSQFPPANKGSRWYPFKVPF